MNRIYAIKTAPMAGAIDTCAIAARVLHARANNGTVAQSANLENFGAEEFPDAWWDRFPGTKWRNDDDPN